MSKYKVILADDHDLVRAGLKSLIEKEDTFEIVGEADDGEKLLDLLKTIKCDLVVTDISMPHMDGLTAVKVIKKKYPKIKILILSMLKDYEHFKQAIANGASGYLLKEDASYQLTLAMSTVLQGKEYFSPNVSKVLTDRLIRSVDEEDMPSLEILTKKETEVLKLVTQGLANKNIAQKLKISIRTVETHRSNLTNKLGIKSTAGLVKYAISKGLV